MYRAVLYLEEYKEFPLFWDIRSLSSYLNIPVSNLVRTVSQSDENYKTFFINKDTGKICKYSETLRLRRIDAPSESLKVIQNAIKDLIVALPYSEANYGFVEGKSIKDAAAALAHGEVIVHCDIKDFFPSHTTTMLLKTLKELLVDKYGSLFTSDFISFLVKAVTLNGRLPQGSPCSPIITAVINKEIDDKLGALGSKYNLKYARYADDLCFSGHATNNDCTLLLNELEDLVHPLRLNAKKTGIMRTSAKPVCTGYSIKSKTFLQSTLQAKLASIIRGRTPNCKINTSTHEVVVSLPLASLTLEEFNNEIKELNSIITKKYPKIDFMVKKKFFYIQSAKTVLGLHLDDGNVIYPSSKYKELRLEAMLVGMQRAYFYLKKLAITSADNELLSTINRMAINSVSKNTRKTRNFRNMLIYPLNRRVFNGKKAYIKNVDPKKGSSLDAVEEKYFIKTIKRILNSYESTYQVNNATSLKAILRRFLHE